MSLKMDESHQIIQKNSYKWNTLVQFSEEQNCAIFRLSGDKGIKLIKVWLASSKRETLFKMKVQKSGFGVITQCSNDLTKILLNWSHLGSQDAGQILINSKGPKIEQKVNGLCLNNAVFLGDTIYVDYGDKQLVETNCQLDKVICKVRFQKRIIQMITMMDRLICLGFKSNYQLWDPKTRKTKSKYFLQSKKQKYESALELQKQPRDSYHITYLTGTAVKCVQIRTNKLIRAYKIEENQNRSVCNKYILFYNDQEQKLITLPELKSKRFTLPFSGEMIIQNDMKIFTTSNNTTQCNLLDLQSLLNMNSKS